MKFAIDCLSDSCLFVRQGYLLSPATAAHWATEAEGIGRPRLSALRRVELAVKEIHRGAKMGLKGLEFSCSWDMEPTWHPSWEPFWQAVDEAQLPFHFHTFPTTPPRARQEGG
jgi:hypothetical protein